VSIKKCVKCGRKPVAYEMENDEWAVECKHGRASRRWAFIAFGYCSKEDAEAAWCEWMKEKEASK